MVAFSREHTWGDAIFYGLAISLCICIDIFQHSVPLPFLPPALSAQGHGTMEIAAVMGSYYWSGCAGGLLLTSYQFYRVLYGRPIRPTWSEMRSHVWKLIIGLTLGMVTLLVEAYNPPWIPDLRVHLVCRLCQGFIGAFLFFYSYLLAVKLFDGAQQVFALTSASIALNVAEVFGPAVGASIFTAFGPAAPYLFLVILSVLNNLLLWVVLSKLPTGDEYDTTVAFDDRDRSFSERCDTLKRLVTEPLLWRAVLVIAPAAGVKSCFESVLPFFGQQHDYSEMRVGFLFMVVAVAYITASVGVGYTWLRMTSAQHSVLIFLSLGGLAAAASGVLSAYKINWHMDEFGLADFTRHEAFYAFLFAYGVFLGLTHTPASYFLGNAVDKFEDAAAQDAVNGIFNSCWELGGSIGFLCSGMASRHSWREEQAVLGSCAAVVGAGALLFVASSEAFKGTIERFRSPEMQKLLP